MNFNIGDIAICVRVDNYVVDDSRFTHDHPLLNQEVKIINILDNGRYLELEGYDTLYYESKCFIRKQETLSATQPIKVNYIYTE